LKGFLKKEKACGKFYELVIRHRKIIFAVFIGIAVICAMAQKFVSVNYDMNSYLPEDSPSTVALDVMEDEFDGGIPNARVLIYNVTVPEALSYKEKLGEIDGVTDVTWLDDAVTEKQVQILKKTSSIRNSFF
jgi:predicted RND superfamily exporter protein